MLKYTVKRNGIIISEYTSDFADETYYEENWGKPEHKVEVTPLQTIYHEAIPSVLDEEGEELEPAVEAYTEVIEATFEVVPSEYLVEIEDMTEQLEKEKRMKDRLLELVKAQRQLLAGNATAIWKLAELGCQEYESAAILQDRLKQARYTVQTGIAGMRKYSTVRAKANEFGGIIQTSDSISIKLLSSKFFGSTIAE